ncbi:MAG: glycosyltransferase family 4 protein [Methanosphaera sp.]|nr:glycosyltransferase family 4 protein [Methanosphaera sp.]
MNICIIGQYPPQVGGIATYTKQLEDNLIEAGHNVYILTYPCDEERPGKVFEARTVNVSGLRGLSFAVSGYRKIQEIIKKYDIDVIHANYVLPAGLIASLITIPGIRVVLTVHGSDINILAQNKLLKPLIKRVLSNMDDVYFVSKELQEKALALNVDGLEETCQVIPNTVNTNRFKPASSTDNDLSHEYGKPVVVFIGNLVQQKGLLDLLQAKHRSTTDYQLLIYGEGDQRNNLESYIKQVNLSDVKLMGKTTTPEEIIPRVDIMVLPSIFEGSSIVALETMACAKPLITTDVGNISSIITTGFDGIIVPPSNPRKLAEAIDDLVDDLDRCENIGRNAKILIDKKYSNMRIPYIEEE